MISIILMFAVGPALLTDPVPAKPKEPVVEKPAQSIYDFTVTDIDGGQVKLDKYKGNVLLIVNTASK